MAPVFQRMSSIGTDNRATSQSVWRKVRRISRTECARRPISLAIKGDAPATSPIPKMASSIDRLKPSEAAANSVGPSQRSEEHTSELQSLMRISYAVFCLKKKQRNKQQITEQ